MEFQMVLQRLRSLANEQPGCFAYACALEALAVHQGWPNVEVLNEMMGGSAISFVEQSARSPDCFLSQGQDDLPSPFFKRGSAAHYVYRICSTGEVLTRTANLHDFANALTWIVFPRTKKLIFRALFEDYKSFYLSIGLTSGRKLGNLLSRGRGRGQKADRLTHLDEAGVVRFVGNPALSPDYVILGHALLENLVLRKPAVHSPTWSLNLGCHSFPSASRRFWRDEDLALALQLPLNSEGCNPDDQTTLVGDPKIDTSFA